MKEKEVLLTEEQLESVNGGFIEKADLKCPYCGSMNIVPYHSPSRGTAFLCCDCYHSIDKKGAKE